MTTSMEGECLNEASHQLHCQDSLLIILLNFFNIFFFRLILLLEYIREMTCNVILFHFPTVFF